MRIPSSLLVVAPLVSTVALFAACGGGTVEGLVENTDAGSSGATSSSGGSSGTTTPSGLPSVTELPADEFSLLKPGGDTLCALGGEYGFAVRPGDPSKVVVEFEGGGACFNDSTCARNGVIYKDTVAAKDYDGQQVGLRDHDNAENPIKGWTHIVVPYCSADVHWGDKDVVHGDKTIHHRGAKNAKAVFEYVYSQFKTPSNVFVTGCSAGGYGSIYWTPELRAHYAEAKVRQFSDSAAGVFPPAYFPILTEEWGFSNTFPTNVGSAADFKDLAYLYERTATTYPDLRLSQYNASSDLIQSQFYNLMGGGGWQAGLYANIGTLIADVPTFRSYMGDGAVHCMIEKDDFYSKKIADTKLSTWLGNIINDVPVANVNCPTCDPKKPVEVDGGL